MSVCSFLPCYDNLRYISYIQFVEMPVLYNNSLPSKDHHHQEYSRGAKDAFLCVDLDQDQ